MKFGLKNYWARTPKILRQIGDSMLVAGTFAMTLGAINSNQRYMLWIGIGCVVAKFLSNFFSEQSLNDKAQDK